MYISIKKTFLAGWLPSVRSVGVGIFFPDLLYIYINLFRSQFLTLETLVLLVSSASNFEKLTVGVFVLSNSSLSIALSAILLLIVSCYLIVISCIVVSHFQNVESIEEGAMRYSY